MSKRLKTALILLFTVFMVTTAFSVVASSLSEDDYLNGTQIKITTYPLNEQLTPDQNNIYNIPVYIKNLLISSAELKTPYSSTFTTTWSCDYNKWISISQKSSSSSLLKINKRPTVEEGDQTVVIAQTVKNKSGDIIAVKEYSILIKHELPIVKLSFNITDTNGAPVKANITVATNVRIPTAQSPDSEGIYSIKAGYEYIYTITADGYKTVSKVFQIEESEKLNVILESGYKAMFEIQRPNGTTTSYATLKVYDADNNLCRPLRDEYDYDTYNYELAPGHYTYIASYSNDSEYAEGEFAITDSDIKQTILLKERVYPVSFKVKPENAVIGLYKNTWKGPDLNNPILPDDNGIYNIKFGQYCYIVEADGFVKVQKTFNATDTKLKNDNYIITVTLLSKSEQLLKDASDQLFRMSGDGFTMNEFTGSLREPDDEPYFTPWDIDSNYDITNVCEYIEELLVSYSQKYEGIKASIVAVKSDYDWRYNDEFEDIMSIKDMPDNYTVIANDGTINYTAVNSNKIDDDYNGEVWCVSLKLSLNEYETVTDYYDFIVPVHIYTREERLNDLVDKYSNFDTICGNNKSIDNVLRDLNLSFDFEDDYYYFVNGSWSSNKKSIISDSGKVTRAEHDETVELTLTVSYSEAQLEEGGFLMDPGPLGDGIASKTIYVKVPGTGHNYSGDYICEEEANCIYGGLMVKRCTICGEILLTYSTSPNGHSFTDWIANGNSIYIRSCKSCGYEQTKAMETESSDVEESSTIEETSEEVSAVDESSTAEESSEAIPCIDESSATEEPSKADDESSVTVSESSSEIGSYNDTESSDSQSVTPSTADNGVVSIAIITLLTLCAALYVKKLR